MDPSAQGRYQGPVGGQDARQAQPDSRELAEPVERFAKPLLHLDTPASAVWVTPASIHLFSGQDHSVSAQGDVHLTAAHTVSSVSGQTTSFYTHAGGVKAITANAALSVRAHTDAQQIWSEQDLTVQSTTDEVRIQASKSITLTAGQSQIVIEGGDITFSCPGTWTVKGASHDWLGGGSQAAQLEALPEGVATEAPNEIELHYHYDDLSPVKGSPYKVTFDNGTTLSGQLDDQGYKLLSGVPAGAYEVAFGEDASPWKSPPLPPDDASFAKPEVQRQGAEALQAMLKANPAEEELLSMNKAKALS